MSSPAYDSASAIVGASATVRHLLHIDGYSHTKTTCPTGQCIRSRPFMAGGSAWSICFYPNGDCSGSDEHISIFLCLEESKDRPPVVAQAKFNILDQDGEPVPPDAVTSPYEFSGNGFSYGFHDFIERNVLEESEWLKDDSFRIVCEVSVSMHCRTESRPPSCVLPVVPPSDLHRHLGDLLVGRCGTDVTFHVADETFSAHRCILASRSPVFKAQFFGAMRESANDVNRVSIWIHDMAPQVFEALLYFVYTDSLPEMKGHEELVMAQHLLEAADRYDMLRLKLICEEKLCKHLEVSTAATTLVLAEQHRCHELKKACFEFLQSHLVFQAVLATDGFEHLTKSCPALVNELVSRHIVP